ncbi:unnamed protein product [Chrysodeixis includens]|uniref:CUB domain-containing protein n=1 Tax=Chrysodeixis includens TaxID=689277 RepID=A0A9P0BJV0_CHRIL|nr:unnamed protein product [Chrysodeixis includens]
MCSQSDCYKVIFTVILVLVISVDCLSATSKFGRNSGLHDAWKVRDEGKNDTLKRQGRGFLFGGGLFALGKVLNFFPVGGERECQPTEGYNIAKAGICLNQYDCRQRDGRATGDCAHGLGVCCVFEVSCGGSVQNNLTYFMSPGFPELWSGEQDCNITIEKTHAGIMQLRIDFLHFTIGQPNRMTGDCDEDAMILKDGDSEFKLCGQNHGQHVYYTLSTASEKREAGDLPGTRTISLSMRMRGGDMPRIWLMRLAQMPLAHTSPHGCMQYYNTDNGTIKTFNFATNGRHLASQDYKACIRRNSGFCSIRYAPCDHRSFRIGPSSGTPAVIDPVDTQQDEMMPVDDTQTQEDEIEGSGNEPDVDQREPPQPSLLSRIWTYISSWMWGQGRSSRWSPYIQHYAQDDRFRYFGYGNYGIGLTGFGRQRCQDRVTIPCENDYFISSGYFGGVCDPHHCGNTFCPNRRPNDCHVETSVTPFAVSVHFGARTHKRSPEENIGMCLRYTQIPCDA